MADNNNNNPEDIEYHRQDQRKHYRINTPFWVKVEGKTYKTDNWSVGGLSLDNFHREISPGEILDLKILIKFQDFNVGFDAKAKAVSSEKGKVRLKFIELSERSKNILQFFSQSIISGQMVDVEDTIKRIDVPINFQEENIEESRRDKPPFMRLPLKTMFFTLFYLTAGIILILYISLVLYSNFVHMKIESAVVSAPTETIVSPFEGSITKIHVQRYQAVKDGDPLITLRDYDLEQAIEVEKTNLAKFKAEATLRLKQYDSEKKELNIYSQVGKNKLKQAKANLQATVERLQNASAQYARAKALYAKRYISKADLDKAEAENDSLVHQVDAAKHALGVEVTAMQLISSGHYFSNDTLQGKVPQLKAAAEQGLRDVGSSEKRIAALLKQMTSRTLYSPFDGEIIGIFKSTDNTVSNGDNLMMVERNEMRVITAFLTQDEVVEVKAGQEVSVYIPALKKRYMGTVTKIDRTEGFLDEVDSEYRPRTINDRSAKVEIALNDFTIESARKVLRPGMPSIIYIKRSLMDGIRSRLQLYFASANNPKQDAAAAQPVAPQQKAKPVAKVIQTRETTVNKKIIPHLSE